MKIPFVVKFLGLAVPVGTTFFDFIGTVARVDGTSMQPCLNPFPDQVDYVFLNKWAMKHYKISKGEIICFKSPKSPDVRYIKRVIALEGDSVITLPYHFKKKIPVGHCWVEGDHAGNSLDSHTFGPISLGLITAKATHIVWPPSRWSSLQNGKVNSSSQE